MVHDVQAAATAAVVCFND